nr:hypothetical protein Hi04_10k_c5202_00028 [uncultured bacterium]
MNRSLPATALAALLAISLFPTAADAFCGFYVGKADAQLFNDASQVVLVRDGERTVVTMSNDYKGDLKEFALVVPVPTVLTREQVHVGERKYVERLDAYSAPRLVEYFDENPCDRNRYFDEERALAADGAMPKKERSRLDANALGVKVEAQFTIGEYDIVILSAKESTGLETWLRESGYRIPPRAANALAPYIRQDMKFFVAKVNLKEQQALGFKYLRPLQMAYESKKFMLPIRLGMANANGPQDMVVYAITRNGRVESTNYRTTKIPSDMGVPLFVKDDFGKTYKAIYEKAYEKESRRALFTEYVWNMAWCDPCSAEPLKPEELRNLGVFWQDEPNGGQQVVLTRLHVRYDSEHFPEDLVFQQTGDQGNFQARYILRHAFQGKTDCAEAKPYWDQVRTRHRQEAQTLAEITGWDLETIRSRMGKDAPPPPAPWYRGLWK